MYIKKFAPFSNVRKAKIYLAAKQICQTLNKNGFESYLVGGCVRDLLMQPNVIPKDLDITTSAPVEMISSIFQNTHFVGNAFGVCLVHMNSFTFEVASFRKEGKYEDRRRPESVAYASFAEDSNRRDFTINALYYDMQKKVILDFHNGLTDLKSKKIRCVGNASDRLYEDSLRILRLCRFAANFGFTIEQNTKIAAQKHASGIAVLPKERILLELNKVYNFQRFVGHVIKIADLAMIFETGSEFFQTNTTRNLNFFNFYTQYPLFNFIVQLSFCLKIVPNKLKDFLFDLKNFPSLNRDKQICKEYLQLISFEHLDFSEFNKEHIAFIFYLESRRIKKYVSDKIFRKIFENLSFFITEKYLKEEISFLKENIPHEQKYAPKEISEIIIHNGISVHVIQTTIDFLEYKWKKNERIDDVTQFILENMEFIKKVAQR
jgi:hypothetical protein